MAQADSSEPVDPSTGSKRHLPARTSQSAPQEQTQIITATAPEQTLRAPMQPHQQTPSSPRPACHALQPAVIPDQVWASGGQLRLVDPTGRSVVAALQRTIERLRHSDESSRYERNELLAALSVKMVDVDLVNECEDLRAAVLLAKANNSLNESCMEVLRVEVIELNKALEKCRADLRAALTLKAKFHSELSNLHGEMKAFRAEKSKEGRAAAVEIANLKERLTVERDKMDALEKNASETLREELEKQVNLLQKSHEKALKEAKEGARAADKSTTQSAKQMEKDLKSLQEKAKKDARSVLMHKTEVDKLQDDLAQSKDREEACRKEIEVVKAELENGQAHLKQIQSDVKSAQNAQKKAEAQHDKLQTNFAHIQTQLENAQADAAQLRAALEAATEKKEDPFLLPPSSLRNSQVDGLISPAPLRGGRSAGLKSPVERASESRSRFTNSLPNSLRDEIEEEQGDQDDTAADAFDETWDEIKPEVKAGRNTTTRAGRSKSAPTSKRKLNFSEDGSTAQAPEDNAAEAKRGKPRAKRRKVASERPPTKPVQKSPAAASEGKKESSPVAKESDQPVMRKAGSRRLRSRKRISYDYNQEGRDIVNVWPGFEVDTTALRKKPVGKARYSTTWESPSKTSPVEVSTGGRRGKRQSKGVEGESTDDETEKREVTGTRRKRRTGRTLTVRKSLG